ncbi:hypothetical protein [Bifidobacterium eulemuris]|uniref:Restriction endonuclease type IV Mrr domain-containing protein n=1 Tax=Bifidobacterium eulemuris TaxID=1765219 RepID=A0A261G9Y1_9BIFI|nr:hypothetical protein [Bifidobacterium eulemuris]OZG68220.1 hypothetical protein BEUL_1233 [Bifidobacterium eulemuris]QOL31723.1 hypothetical protein BE0216_04025 [Bifidobacterium eulemuris]
MSKSKKKGTAWESAVVEYLQWALDDRQIQRMVLSGNKDKGDLTNVWHHGQRVCVECKDTQELAVDKQWSEAVDEAGNLDATLAVLIKHREGFGVKKMGSQYAIMQDIMLDRFLERSEPSFATLARTVSQPLKSSKLGLVWIPLRVFAVILNDGLPLGPEEETKEES